MKKTLSLLLAVSMLTTMLMSFVAAAETTSGTFGENNTLTWTLDSETKTLTISGTGAIPDIVAANATSTPYYTTEAEHLVIETGVTSIGTAAFYNWRSLKTIEIKDGVTQVGNHAFNTCLYVEKIILPSTEIKANQFAFKGCGTVTKKLDVYTGHHMGTWYNNAFYAHSAEENTHVTVNIHHIYRWKAAYAARTWAADANITVNYFIGGIFGNNNALEWTYDEATATTTISGTGAIPDYTNDTYSSSPFYNANMEHVVIQSGITTIGQRAFMNCKKIKSVHLNNTPNGFTINAYAFYGCTDLSKIVLPNKYTNCKAYAFTRCGTTNGVINIYTAATMINWDSNTFASTPTNITLNIYQKYGAAGSMDTKTWTSTTNTITINRYLLEDKIYGELSVDESGTVTIPDYYYPITTTIPASQTLKLIVTAYDSNDKLIGLDWTDKTFSRGDSELINPISFTYTNEDAAYYRAFLWTDFGTAKPMIASETSEIAA